ncbi:MAG: CrcB family protein [Dehalococcoidia bacterium]|nr:CrcB family protein [Dehalococcoidia bacterium]
MTYFLLVALGGAAGAMARYGVDRVVFAHLASALVATAIVNVSGSFALGLLAGFLGPRSGWPDQVTMLVAVGFLGSYTTFSTLSLATVTLLEEGNVSGAAVNLTATVVLGLAAAFAGLLLGRAVA